MRIGIYDPYLDTLGGGEKYALSIASCLMYDHEVSLFWDDPVILKQASERFSLDLSQVKIKKNIFGKDTSFLRKLVETKKYDCLIFMSDGSIPWLFSKKSFILFQFPVPWVKMNILNTLKFTRIHGLLCYSEFVKDSLKKTFKKPTFVLSPPITMPQFAGGKKENIILTVGRLTKAMNAKKQEVMVETFKQMCAEGLKGWKLVLAGGMLSQDEDFLHHLKYVSKNFPIEIHENISYKNLIELYKKAKIYWHAAGFGEDLSKYPERAEHFGITTVEAMSQQAVPIVFSGGGQKEIVKDTINGYLWREKNELIEKTIEIINNETLMKEFGKKAEKTSQLFSLEEFKKNLLKILL